VIQAEAPSSRRTRPLRNASYQAIAALVGKAFSFVLLLNITRALGPGRFGNYTFVLSFVGLFGVLTDLGMGTLAVRDVAQDRTLHARYISNILAVRTLSTAIGVLLIIVLAQVLVAPNLRSAVYVYAVALVPLAMTNTFSLVFQIEERLIYSSVLGVATSAVTTLCSLAILAAGHHVLGLVTVFTGVAVANAAVAAWLVYGRFLLPKLHLEPRWWLELSRRAAPFSALTVLGVLYSRGDMLLLSWLSGCQGANQCVPVGYYGAAYRALDVLAALFVGTAITATLPAFNRVVQESHAALTRFVRSAVTLSLAFGVPVALFGTVYAPEALHVLGGRSYMAAALAEALLVWTFPCFLVVGMLNSALFALHRQRAVTVAFAITLVFNASFNLILIPYYSFYASGALTTASEALNIGCVFLALRKSLGPLGLGAPALKITLTTAVVAAVLWLLRPLGIVVGLPVGAVLILVGFRVTSLLGPAELHVLRGVPLIGRYARYLRAGGAAMVEQQ